MAGTKVLVLIGPTASGKSALAVELAQCFDGEVVSADSRQVYRGLDIGTGKVTKREMRGVRHHLLDIVSPKKTFSAGDYVARASAAIADITTRGKLPIICGGTGFYIDALMGRVALAETPPDPALRTRLAGKSTAQLFALLQKKDPVRAATMDTPSERNNRVRLIRALEIAEANAPRRRSEKSFLRPERQAEAQKGFFTAAPTLPYDALWIGIHPPFDVLEKKIEARLTARLRRGMIAEATRLHAAGLSYKRMRALGLEYRSLARYLQGEITRPELEAELARDIRRYAKSQLAYWKRNKDITWFDPNNPHEIKRHIDAWLRQK